jgi:hypothetical protein
MGRDPNLDEIWTLVGQDAETDVTWILMVRIRMWSLLGQDPDMVWMRTFMDQDPETDLI